MAAIALGVGAALSWGLADFLGGLQSRRLTLAAVLLVSQLTALTTLGAIVLLAGLEVPTLGQVAPAIAAGACQLAGIAALYRALAIGTMSVISPISASGAAALPVIVGVAGGERPAVLQVIGMVAALVGVILATRTPGSEQGPVQARQALALAAVAALGFGGFFVAMDAAVADAQPFWALLVARATALTGLVVALIATRPRLGVDSARLRPLVLLGLIDVAASACFALGTDTGLLSVVSVLASLYPVTTVVLARSLLDERLAAVQTAGVAVALTGVALIAAG